MKKLSFDQQGSALIISLLILIVMTLIGLTGIGTSTLEEKMAGNTRDQALAFQAAEAALRDGEDYFNNTIVSATSAFNGSIAGLYPKDSHPDVLAASTWDNARIYSGTIDGVKEKPRYIIEFLGPITDATTDININNYGEATGLGNLTAVRVTARATGGTGNSVVVVQSNFSKRI
jgi:type IV pilus assembly protein PilX